MKHVTSRFLLMIACTSLSAQATDARQNCSLERVTVSASGQSANGDSAAPTLSSDGRYAAYGSSATNLVPGDLNGLPDSFVLDRVTGAVEMISISTGGTQGNGRSVGPKLSADGRMVAFNSQATNLDPRDTDTVLDVYVHDRVTKTTTLVSERLGSGTSLQGCYDVAISGDGRYVAFTSSDGNVLPGIPANNVFVRDLATQTTECVSLGPQGQVADIGCAGCSISGDGRFVAFKSLATNWFPYSPKYASGVFVRDRRTSTTIPVTLLPTGELCPGAVEEPVISSDGRYVAFFTNSRFLTPDQPFFGDVLRWDRLTGAFVNACVPMTGGKPNYPSRKPSLSADGRYLVFETYATNLTLQTSKMPVALWKDMETGASVVVNEAPDGGPADEPAYDPVISADGRAVAFESLATNLLPGSGGLYHVYVRACDVASPSTYCKPAKPTGGCVGLLAFQGEPSATAGSGFDVRAGGVDANKLGLFFYGKAGPWGQPVTQGFLCVQGAIVRALVSNSGGTSGCAGVLSMDMNAWIASGADPALVAGQTAYVQAWFRNALGSSQLTDALALLIGP